MCTTKGKNQKIFFLLCIHFTMPNYLAALYATKIYFVHNFHVKEKLHTD